MASKAYIASMTVAELSSELKKRGLSCRGKKKTLQSRLEEALENEELSESSSEGGREATIRAASAVISQLEGDTSVNNFNMSTTNPTMTALQEELVVSIEHSRRLQPQQTDNTSNGDDEILQSGGRSPGSMDKHIPRNVPLVDSIPPTSQIGEHPVSPQPINEENKSSSVPVKDVVTSPVKDMVTSPVKDVVTSPVKDVVTSPVQCKSSPPLEQANVQQDDDTSVPHDEPPHTPTQNEPPDTPSSPSHQLPLPMSASTTPTVDRSGFLVPPPTGRSFMSPMDTDGESEVNSVAVEPPSPNRDDISFAVDEGNVSVSGSVDLMDTTMASDGGDVPEDVSTPVQPTTKVMVPTVTTSVPPDSDTTGHQSQQPADDIDKVRQEDEQVGVSSQSGLDSGTIELDVLVPTVEEEDMSVFSAEAAEVQKLDNKVLEKPSTLFENDGIDTSSTNMRSLSASDKTTESVGGGLDSCTNGSKKRNISLSDEKREDRERSGTPTTKRRRISTSPKRAQERRRKWGSSTSRTPTAAPTAISSDILENIIPDEVKEEVSEQMANMSSLEAVMIYDDDTNHETQTVDNKKDEDLEQPSTEQQPMDVVRDDNGDETKPVEEEDILDLGKESSMVDEYEQEWKEKEEEREQQRKESLKAKQELETRRRIEARVKARQQQEKIEEKDKPVVRRTPSPARNPPSRMIHIVNLTRPFTNIQLKDLLQDGEDVLVEKGCWTDRIKSHCIAVFLTMESAITARNRIHNLKWPRQNPRLLKADYLTPKEVYEFSNGELEIQTSSSDEQDNKMVVNEEQIITKEVQEPSKKQQPQQVTNDRKRESVQEKDNKQRLLSSNEKEELKEEKKPKSMLDRLFRKTQATPPIYWLPLTEKEVKEKEAEHAAEELERQKRREERRKERELEEQAREKKLREEREERARERVRRRRGRSDSRSRSPRYRRRSRSPRRHSPIRRGHSPRRSRSPVRRRRSTRSRSHSPR